MKITPDTDSLRDLTQNSNRLNGINRRIQLERVYSIDDLDIQKTRCNAFVQSLNNRLICSCGLEFTKHHKDVQINTGESLIWDINSCTCDDGPTDAYGEAKFIHNIGHSAKYIRVSHRTHMDTMLKLLFEYWQLDKPKLIISVTGGAQRFTLNPRLKQVFSKGLVKAADTTNAWISTGGLHTGVMKYVGEAIRKIPDKNIIALGIATWTMVLNNHTLVQTEKNVDRSVEYSITSIKEESNRKQPLDPNHTHFILVDNAKIAYGGEISFRAELESAVANYKSNNIFKRQNNKKRDEDPVPIVVLVVNGGPGTIDTVIQSVQRNSPCVFVKGSGNSADIFAYAIENKPDSNDIKVIEKTLESDIKAKIKTFYDTNEIDKLFKKIMKVLDPSYSHLLNIFEIDKNDKQYDLDVSILRAFLKANKRNYVEQLGLALTWNRVDIARNFIFNEDISWQKEQLNSVVYKSILGGNSEFIRLFYEHGFAMKKFLTHRRLLKLYNDLIDKTKEGKYSCFYQIITKSPSKYVNGREEFFGFKDIGWALQYLLKDIYEPKFVSQDYNYIDLKQFFEDTDEIGEAKSGVVCKDYSVTALHLGIDINESCENPEYELFLLSILSNSYEMAKFFWEIGINEIGSALIASRILKSMAEKADADTDRYIKMADSFENLAVEVIDSCHNADEKKAENLLIRQIPEFGHLTSIQIAFSANRMKFIGHSCCQNLMTRFWYKQLDSENSKFLILLCTFLPFLAPIVLDYRVDRDIKRELKDQQSEFFRQKSSEDTFDYNYDYEYTNREKSLSIYEKFILFFKTPLVKFIYDQIAYILFLTLFTYVLLCDFFPISTNQYVTERFSLSIALPEVLLHIWVISSSIDFIFRQFFVIDLKLFKAKLNYFINFWNIIHALSFLLYLVPLVLRFIPNSHECYLAARVLFSIDIILWYIFSLSYYSVFRYLGPKVVMIKTMMVQLAWFMSIIIVFMLSFGVSTQSLMYHNQELNFELVNSIFLPAYWVIGGEFFTRDTIMGADSCVSSYTNSKANLDIYKQVYGDQNSTDCPEKIGARISMGIYVIYLIVLNILLVNLLIAIFSNTFQIIQNESDNVWKFQRYSLIYDYCHRPILTGPFIVISHTVIVIRLVLRPFREKCFPKLKSNDPNPLIQLFLYFSKRSNYGFKLMFKNEREEKSLVEWESIITDSYLSRKNQALSDSDSSKINSTFERIDILQRKLESCEKNISSILKILNEQFGTLRH